MPEELNEINEVDELVKKLNNKSTLVNQHFDIINNAI